MDKQFKKSFLHCQRFS